MRGFQYKDKEGVEMFLVKSYVNARFTLSGVMLTRGFTVYLFLPMCFLISIIPGDVMENIAR